jgi:hypothetical protein
MWKNAFITFFLPETSDPFFPNGEAGLKAGAKFENLQEERNNQSIRYNIVGPEDSLWLYVTIFKLIWGGILDRSAH